jgi:beta-glucosidase-like glycosyl hydrolase
MKKALKIFFSTVGIIIGFVIMILVISILWVLISRNHFSNNPLASDIADDFSLFPEPLGLAAIGDSMVTYQFADIARQEYTAEGMRIALHPQADLATEPRRCRMNGTFGFGLHY